jgi:hypothetical protein
LLRYIALNVIMTLSTEEIPWLFRLLQNHETIPKVSWLVSYLFSEHVQMWNVFVERRSLQVHLVPQNLKLRRQRGLLLGTLKKKKKFENCSFVHYLQKELKSWLNIWTLLTAFWLYIISYLSQHNLYIFYQLLYFRHKSTKWNLLKIVHSFQIEYFFTIWKTHTNWNWYNSSANLCTKGGSAPNKLENTFQIHSYLRSRYIFLDLYDTT